MHRFAKCTPEKIILQDIRLIQSKLVPPGSSDMVPLAAKRLSSVPSAVNMLRETANSARMPLMRLGHMRVAQFETCWELTERSIQPNQPKPELDDLREQASDHLFMTSVDNDGAWEQPLPDVLAMTTDRYRRHASVADWTKRFAETHQKWWGKKKHDGSPAVFLDAALDHYAIAAHALEEDRADLLGSLPLGRRMAVWWETPRGRCC